MLLYIEGDVIQPDVLSVHYDPELWGPEDPKLFYPERHEIKRHPLAFLSFGCGPRNCVGMRLGLWTIKLCLAYVSRHYEIVPSNKMEESLQMRERFVLQPTALFIKLKKLK